MITLNSVQLKYFKRKSKYADSKQHKIKSYQIKKQVLAKNSN